MPPKKPTPVSISKSEDDRLISELLGSAHVFAAAIRHVMEDNVLRSVAGEKSSFTRLKVLKLLSLGETQAVGDIAVFLGVSAAAASKTVDKLVRRGHVERKEDAQDRRAARLLLTESGRKTLESYELERNSRMAQAFADYSSLDIKKATEILDRLSNAIMQHDSHPEKTCLHCGVYFHRTNTPAEYSGCRLHKGGPCDYLLHRQRTTIMKSNMAGRDLG